MAITEISFASLDFYIRRTELRTENATTGHTTIAEFTKWCGRVAEFAEWEEIIAEVMNGAKTLGGVPPPALLFQDNY